MEQLRNQAKDIYDVIYKEGIVTPEAVTARVLDYVLKREKKVQIEITQKIFKSLNGIRFFVNDYDMWLVEWEDIKKVCTTFSTEV